MRLQLARAAHDLAVQRVLEAVLDGDDFVVNGQKVWTSLGQFADYAILLARTDPDQPKHAGITYFILDMRTPGITVRKIEDMTTNSHFCEVWYDNVRVPVENMVGAEGGAFKQTMRQLEHERGGIDRLMSNYALYEIALAKADKSDPIVRQRIAKIETDYRLGRILVAREVLKDYEASEDLWPTEMTDKRMERARQRMSYWIEHEVGNS